MLLFITAVCIYLHINTIIYIHLGVLIISTAVYFVESVIYENDDSEPGTKNL